MSRVTTMDKKEQFIERRAQGETLKEIATALDVDHPEVVKWSRECQTAVNNRRTFEMEKRQQDYYVSQIKRIQVYGEQLERIKAELEQRDLTELPTDKLYDVMIKLTERLKQEEIKPTLKIEQDNDAALQELFQASISEWEA